jgi:uncharacterized protein (TIGR03083 family)
MVLLRVDVLALFPALRSELLDLLSGLPPDDWQAPTSCPGWSVHGVVCHLLGVEIGNVSVRRDSWKISRKPEDDPDTWLNGFNQQWVEACKRVSPRGLVELLSLATQRYIDQVATLDLEALGGPVKWATGDQPAPVWLDMAREYMERFVHRYQVREATGRPALGQHLMAPALTTAAHCLPRALDDLERPKGTTVRFVAEGQGGGAWSVVRGGAGWDLASEPGGTPDCEVATTADGALKLYVRDASAPPLDWRGDPELAKAISKAKAVLG